MALSSVIRRWHFRDQLSIREISERPGKLDAIADKLSAWLRVESTK